MLDYRTPLKYRFRKWTTLTPRGDVIRTGCGIIVDIVEVPEPRYGYYESATDGKLYTVMTDFGNTYTLTLQDLVENYDVGRVEKYPAARIARQQELLDEAYCKYFKGVGDE